MQPVVERGDDAEVAAAAAQTPEEIRVLVGAGRPRSPSAVTTCARTVVAGQPVLAVDPAEPPPRVRPATPVIETVPVGVASP